MKKWLAVPMLSILVAMGLGGQSAAGPDPSEDVAAACPCDATVDGASWTSRAAYVACVAAELRELRAAHTLRAKRARTVLRAARASTCGSAGLTRCCVYATDDDEVGTCRLTTPEACDALDDRMENGEADDAGGGSCVPNPCAG